MAFHCRTKQYFTCPCYSEWAFGLFAFGVGYEQCLYILASASWRAHAEVSVECMTGSRIAGSERVHLSGFNV